MEFAREVQLSLSLSKWLLRAQDEGNTSCSSGHDNLSSNESLSQGLEKRYRKIPTFQRNFARLSSPLKKSLGFDFIPSDNPASSYHRR